MISWSTVCQSGIIVYYQYIRCSLECVGIEKSEEICLGETKSKLVTLLLEVLLLPLF